MTTTKLTSRDTARVWLEMVHDVDSQLVLADNPIINIVVAFAAGDLRTTQEFRDDVDLVATLKALHLIGLCDGGLCYHDLTASNDVDAALVIEAALSKLGEEPL